MGVQGMCSGCANQYPVLLPSVHAVSRWRLCGAAVTSLMWMRTIMNYQGKRAFLFALICSC